MQSQSRSRLISKFALTLIILAASLFCHGSCTPHEARPGPLRHSFSVRSSATAERVTADKECFYTVRERGGWEVVTKLPMVAGLCSQTWGLNIHIYMVDVSGDRYGAQSSMAWDASTGICTATFTVKNLELFAEAAKCWISRPLRPLHCVSVSQSFQLESSIK